MTNRTRAKALNGAGWIAMFQGDYGSAKMLLEEGLALYRKLADDEGVASCLVNLGLSAVLAQRDLASLPALIEEATLLRPKLADPRTIANLSVLVGMLAVSEKDHARALSLHEEALELYREVRDTLGISACLINMAFIEMVWAHLDRSATLARENVRLARGADDKFAIQSSLVTLGGVALCRGHPARAARLWGAAQTLRDAFGMHLSPLARAYIRYEDLLADARGQLGDEEFEDAWAWGKAMTQARAIEYALAEERPSPEPEDAPGSAWSASLTRREEEVAALVARGLTNRRIASNLSISERTAATHVGRILKKLGARSRDEVVDRSSSNSRELRAMVEGR